MMLQPNRTVKVLLSAAILGVLFQPFFVYAQLGIGSVPISNPAFPNDPVSSAQFRVQQALVEAADKGNKGCLKAEMTYGPADQAKEIGFGGLSLIGGSSSEVANIDSKIITLEGFIKCREAVLTSLGFLVPMNILIAERKQAVEAESNTAISNLKQRKEDLYEQSRIAKRGLWKGIIAAVLIKTTKTVSQRLVNTLASKYKINNVMQYADAVASQVYTTQLIRDRATDGQEQLILRSILTNPAVRRQFNSAIYQRAADALELNGQVFSARGMSADDPDLYLKLAKFGDPETSVPYLNTAYQSRADEMSAIGKVSANNEILLGSGLKAPRTCAGNVNEQKGIDQQWALANDKMKNRLELYEELKRSRDTQYKTLSAGNKAQLDRDLQKAQDDYLVAAGELKNLPKSYQNPVLDICEAIASPAEMVNKGIDKAFTAFSKGLGDYNDNNLPFYMNFISDIGSNIASSLIFGGDPKATLLAESGDLSTAINLGLSFADARVDTKNLENGIEFNYDVNSGNTSYTLSWNVIPSEVKDASYVTIKGPGISDIQLDTANRPIIDPVTSQPKINKLQTSGSTMILFQPNGGSYVFRVFNSKGQALSNTASLTVPKLPAASASVPSQTPAGGGGAPTTYQYSSYEECVDAAGSVYCAVNPSLYPPKVLGAFIKKPTESPRGYRTEALR